MAYAPIISPFFAQTQPWPYLKGPNYTRPVFAENDEGAFVATPIIRMPSLKGLGGGGGGGGGHHGGHGGGHHGGHGGGFRRPGGYGGHYGYGPMPWWYDAPYGGFLETTVVDCGPNCTWDGYTCFCPGGKKAASGVGSNEEPVADPWYTNPLYLGGLALAAAVIVTAASGALIPRGY